jgi:Concanavalin A-like lectin/glucanases superfamily/Purple acid Phosphatase, N-terminal domain/Protein of unknown function (DUF1565)
LFCQAASATTYYVATNGNNGNPGTSISPFLTVQRGVDAAGAGDTIIVRNGTYGSNGVGSSGFPVYINKAGTASAPITLKAENKLGAVLGCQLDCHSYINLLDGAAYWVIQDFDITGGYWAGIWANSAAHHYTLRGNHLHHIGNRYDTSDYGIEAFYSDTASHDIVFDGNMFDNIGRTNILPQGPNHDHGIYSHATNATVINNIYHSMFRGWSIQLVDGATNWLIANNTFAFPNPARDGQIVLYGGNNGGSVPVTNVTVRDNIFYQPSNYAIVTNIDVPLNGCTIDHNIIYGASSVIDQASSCSINSNQIGVNPMLVNTSSAPYDFHLQSGSPAVDAGMTVSAVTSDFEGISRPQGAGPDLGASERASASAAPIISGVFTSGVLANSAVINWSTNVGATSYVQYGTSTSYSTTTPQITTLTTVHSVALSNLTASTLYHYRVASADSAGRLTLSPDATFTTGVLPLVGSSFSLSAASSTLSVTAGQSTTDGITATLLSGSAVSVSFSTSGLPAGMTATFSSSTCTTNCSTTLTLSSSTSTPNGAYNIIVSGTGSGITASTTIVCNVSSLVTAPTPPLAADITSALSAWWKFDEGRGNQTSDSSGYGNTGMLQGPKKAVNNWPAGISGTGVSLSGSSDNYIMVNESASLQMTTQLTVAFWLSPSPTSDSDPQPRIIAKVDDWDVKLNGRGRLPQFTAAGKYAQANYSLAANTWQHVVFTFSSGVVKAYVNGNPVALAENTFTGTEILPVAPSGLLIGADAGKVNPYAGLLDRVRIFKRALTSADVALLYSAK